MKHYLRLMLGQRSVYAAECFTNNYIGVDFGINEDLTGKLPEDLQAFNKIFVPKFLENHPDKSKIAAGLACGALWTVSKFLREDDGSRSFYEKFDFLSSPTDPLHLFLLMKDILRILL